MILFYLIFFFDGFLFWMKKPAQLRGIVVSGSMGQAFSFLGSEVIGVEIKISFSTFSPRSNETLFFSGLMCLNSIGACYIVHFCSHLSQLLTNEFSFRSLDVITHMG